MDEAKNGDETKKNFFQKYVYGSGGKTLLKVFLIGALLSILMPSLVNPPMIVVAMAITIIIQRIRKNKSS